MMKLAAHTFKFSQRTYLLVGYMTTHVGAKNDKKITVLTQITQLFIDNKNNIQACAYIGILSKNAILNLFQRAQNTNQEGHFYIFELKLIREVNILVLQTQMNLRTKIDKLIS